MKRKTKDSKDSKDPQDPKGYYKILGANKDTPQDELKKLYRAAAMKWHPDKNKEKDAEETFKKVSEAYEVLSDTDKRSQYDDGLLDSSFNRQNGYSGVDPREFFRQHFANFSSMNFTQEAAQTFVRKDPNNHLSTRISLKDIIQGKKISARFKRSVDCDSCKGRGFNISDDKCPSCKGEGRVTSGRSSANINFLYSVHCQYCAGTGKKTSTCKICNGEGSSEVEEKATISVPAGMMPMMALRLAGVGHTVYVGDEKVTGDTFIVIDFPRKQDGVSVDRGNIYCSITVPFLAAMKESEIKVDILGCKEIKVPLKLCHSTGHVYEVEKEGLSKDFSAFVKVFLDMPKKDVDREKLKGVIAQLEELYGDISSVVRTDHNLNE